MDNIEQVFEQINLDPRLVVLSQAIIESHAEIAQCKKAILSLSNQLNIMVDTINRINESMHVITNQMWVISQKPDFPSVFRGVKI
jgi:hypothetical protein